MPRPLLLILALALTAIHAALGGIGGTVSLCLGHQCDHHAPHHADEHPAPCDHHPAPSLPSEATHGCCCIDVQFTLPDSVPATRQSASPRPVPMAMDAALAITPSPRPPTAPTARPPGWWPDHASAQHLIAVRSTRLVI